MAVSHNRIYVVDDYKGRFNLLACEKNLIHKALIKSGWNVQQAMKLNGVVHLGEDGYRKMIRRHSIDIVNQKLKDVPTTSPSL